MIGSLRLSRIAFPRATLFGLGLLTVVFVTFGFFADAAFVDSSLSDSVVVSDTFCDLAVLDLPTLADNLGEFDG